MANQMDDHLFSNFLNTLESYWDFGVSLSDRQVPDYSYSQQYPPPGQTGHGPSFFPRDIVEQYTNSNDSRIEFQAVSDDNTDPSLSQQLAPQLEGQLLEQEYGPLLRESAGVGRPLNSQHSPAIVTGNELSALTPQNDTFCELSPRVVRAGQKKVHCTVPGCSKVIRKDGLTRHVNETHLGVVKGICPHCGRGFQRRYLKVQHEATCHNG